MTSVKCGRCGFVDFASASGCKRCGAALARPGAPAAGAQRGVDLTGEGGLPGSVKGAIILLTACVVCALTIYWVKPYLPEGPYLVIFFLPFAFVGYIAGLLLTAVMNAVYKGFSSEG